MTDVFGGYNWTQQQLQSLMAYLNDQLQRGIATGYIEPAAPQAGPGRDEAMEAIYSHRYDIEEFYNENWGEGQGTPIQRMENWLSITQERMGPDGNIIRPGDEGYEQAGAIDPLQYAGAANWIEPPPPSAEDYDPGAGEAQPTLEREMYESSLDRWEAEFARTERVDDQTIKQWEDTFAYQKARDEEGDRQWGLDFLRAEGLDQAAQDRWEAEHDRVVGLDAEARRQWGLEFARAEGLDEQAYSQWEDERDDRLALAKDARDQWQKEFLRLQGLDEQAQDRWVAEFDEQVNVAAEDTRRWNEEFMRAQGLDDEAIRQFNIQQGRLSTLDVEDKRRWNAEFARAQGLDTEAIRQWGIEQSLREREFTLTEQQVATAAQQWEQEFGLSTTESERAAQQWSAEFERGGAEWEREQSWAEQYGQGQLGMDYLTLMSTLRGPRDWVQYANTLRAAQQTQFPGWAQQVAQGLGVAPFQGAAAVPAQQAGLPQPAAVAQPPAEGIALGNAPAIPAWGQAFYQQLAARPQLVRPDQWANMTPAEKEMLLGAVESGGGWAPDWMQMMQKAGPTGGQVAPVSWFGGGW